MCLVCAVSVICFRKMKVLFVSNPNRPLSLLCAGLHSSCHLVPPFFGNNGTPLRSPNEKTSVQKMAVIIMMLITESGYRCSRLACGNGRMKHRFAPFIHQIGLYAPRFPAQKAQMCDFRISCFCPKWRKKQGNEGYNPILWGLSEPYFDVFFASYEDRRSANHVLRKVVTYW